MADRSHEEIMKVCSKCKLEKGDECFAATDKWCRGCRKEYASAHYQANKQKLLNKSKRWRDANPDKRKALDRKNGLKRKYGITVGEYDNMLSIQDGKCAVCGDKTKLYVDHCHSTNEVRGLLCHLCNTALGGFRDSTHNLQKAISYLERRMQ